MIWIIASLGMTLAAIALLSAGKREVKAAELEDKRQYDPLAQRRPRWTPDFIVRYLNRLGLNLSPSTIALLLTVEVMAMLLMLLSFEFSLAIIAIVSMLLFSHIVLQSWGTKQKQQLLMALPSFLNQVSRRLSAGVSVEHAFTDSMENIEGPLELAMRRIMQRVGLGLDLYQAFERESQANGLKELRIVATALHINEQFGGSIRAVLEDIVHILRLDDMGKRELKAQTGETRVTAIVLTMLPIGMVFLLLTMNPDFLMQMWDDALGNKLLMGAAVMQILGATAMWRMVRAI